MNITRGILKWARKNLIEHSDPNIKLEGEDKKWVEDHNKKIKSARKTVTTELKRVGRNRNKKTKAKNKMQKASRRVNR